MQQFNPVDAALLYLESTRTPMHVAMAYVYDVTSCPDGPPSFEDIREEIRACLPKVPQFRRKIIRSPLNADYPYWIEDADFDLDYHVRHTSLPRPGGWRELRELFARLISRPLDLSRPPWDLTVIEGLNDIEGVPPGGFAICLKIHHCAIDGKAGVALANTMHHGSPRGRVRTMRDHWKPEPMPTQFSLATKTWLNNVKRSSKVSNLLLKNWSVLLRAGAGKRKSTRADGEKLTVPDTIFGGEVSPHRIYDEARCALDDIKAVRRSVAGATVNDVAITIVAECMRNYLLERDALPDDPLVSIVPIAINSEEADKAGGNQVNVARISMRTDIADPIERLRAITEATSKMKTMQNGLVMKTMLDVVYNLPGQLVGLAAKQISVVLNATGQPANTMISNVPSSQVPIYFRGARMVRNFGTSPLLDGGKIMHAVSSYCGEFVVNFTACRSAFDDVDDYTRTLDRALKTVIAAGKNALSSPTSTEPIEFRPSRKRVASSKAETGVQPASAPRA